MNFIRELGIEFGNIHGYFSWTAPNGADAELLEDHRTASPSWVRTSLVDAELKIDEVRTNRPGCWERETTFTASKISRLYDMVVRFVLAAPQAADVSIAGHTIRHCSKNLYHQFETTCASIKLNESRTLKLKASFSYVPRGFRPYIYARDLAKNGEDFVWVIHVRLMAEPGHLRLRGCHPLFNRALPAGIDRCVPHVMKKPLYRIRETRWNNCPIMALSESEMQQGTEIKVRTELTLERTLGA